MMQHMMCSSMTIHNHSIRKEYTMPMESSAPAPSASEPKRRANVLRWLEAEPTPFGDCKSQAGNAKLGRLAELEGKAGPVQLRVVGVRQQWLAMEQTIVELYRCGDGSWGAQPLMRRDAAAPSDAF
jgi:hypothetical protein